MIIDGVNFNVEAIKKLTLEQFIGQCADVFWGDRKKSDRKKVLTEVYYQVNPKKEEPVKEAEE